MSFGSFVRWVSALIVLGVTAGVAGVVLLRLWTDDNRPMTIRLHSGLTRDLTLRVSANFNSQDQRRVPVVRLRGLNAGGLLTLPAGRIVEIPARVDPPGGVWQAVRGEVVSGDVQGTVVLEAVPPAADFPKQEIPVTVRVESLAETWWPALVLSSLGAAGFALLVLLSFLLVPPTGRLEIRDRATGRTSEVFGGRHSYDLASCRYRWRFWKRDLLLANGRFSSNLVFKLPDGSKPAFALRFGERDPSVLALHDGLRVQPAHDPEQTVCVVAIDEYRRWQQQRTGEETRREGIETPQSATIEPAAESSLPIAPQAAEAEPATERADADVYFSYDLESGAGIVAGDYLIVYENMPVETYLGGTNHGHSV